MYWIGHGTFALLLQPLEKCGHVTGLGASQYTERRRIEGVDSGIYIRTADRFFLETHNINAFCRHDAKWVLPLMKSHCHSSGRTVADMKIKYFRVSNIGKHIPVRNCERNLRPRI